MNFYRERMLKLARLLREGKSIEELAQRFCISKSTVRNNLRKYDREHPVVRPILDEDPALELMLREL